MSRPLPFTIGSYRVDEKLGAGGMGVVYKAVDTTLDRVVAIKMMHSRELLGDDVDLGEIQTRFLREAKAAARIKSRHVASVLQMGTTDDGEAYIVMEMLHGVALSKVMRRGGPMAPTRVVHIARQICRGMHSAHDLGVVHRDLKPANVMLIDEEGDADFVKILDFGVAKLTNDHTQGLTQAGALLGTLPFMAPEQISGQAVDARTDVYSLGVILYRMFTGLTVWDADSLSDIVRHQMSSTPASMFERVTNAQFSPLMDTVVLKCLAKDPASRWQSMRELATALDEGLAQGASSSPSPAASWSAEANGFDDSTALLEKGTSPTGNVNPPAVVDDRGRNVFEEAATNAVASVTPPPRAGSWVPTMPLMAVPPPPPPPLSSLSSSMPMRPPSRSLPSAVAPPRRRRMAVAAIGAVVVVTAVVFGVLQTTSTPTTTSTTLTAVTPLPPVIMPPVIEPIVEAVVAAPAEPVVAEPVVAAPVVAEPVVVTPPKKAAPTPVTKKPPKPTAPVDDGFVRVRTKDGT